MERGRRKGTKALVILALIFLSVFVVPKVWPGSDLITKVEVIAVYALMIFFTFVFPNLKIFETDNIKDRAEHGIVLKKDRKK